MNVSFNPAIPGYLTGHSRLESVTRSRRFLIMLTAILSFSCCSVMFCALIGTERYLVFVADFGIATVAIAVCCALGIGGAIGGSCSTIALLAVRRA